MLTKDALIAESQSKIYTNGAGAIKATDHETVNEAMINNMWMPVGSMMPWLGTANTVPDGWHLCNAPTLFLKSDYQDLYDALGGDSDFIFPLGTTSSTGDSFYIPRIVYCRLLNNGNSLYQPVGYSIGISCRTDTLFQAESVNIVGGVDYMAAPISSNYKERNIFYAIKLY